MPPKGSKKAAASKRKLDEPAGQPEAKRLQQEQHPITNPVAADLLKLYAAYNSILTAATHGDVPSKDDYLILLEAAQSNSVPSRTIAAGILPKFAPLFPDLLDSATEAIIQFGSFSLDDSTTTSKSPDLYNTISGLNYLLDASEETGNTSVVLSLVTFIMRVLSSTPEEELCWKLLTKAFICFPQIVLAGVMHALQDSSIPQCQVCCRLLTQYLLKPQDDVLESAISNTTIDDDDDNDNTLMMLALKYKAVHLDPNTRHPSSSSLLKKGNGTHTPPLPPTTTIASMVFTTLPPQDQEWVHNQCITTLKMNGSNLGVEQRQLLESLLDQIPRLTSSPSPPPLPFSIAAAVDADKGLRPPTGAVAVVDTGGRGTKRGKSSNTSESPQPGNGSLQPSERKRGSTAGDGGRSHSLSRQSTPSSIEAGEIPVGPPPPASKKTHYKGSNGKSPPSHLEDNNKILPALHQQPPLSSSLPVPVTDELPHAVSSDKPTPAAACLVIRGLPTTTTNMDTLVKTMCEKEAGRGAVALVYSPSSKKGSTYVVCHSMKDAVKIVQKLDGSTPSSLRNGTDSTTITRPIDVRLCQTTLIPPPSSSSSLSSYNMVYRCHYLWVPASVLELHHIREVSGISSYLAKVSTALPDPTESILEVCSTDTTTTHRNKDNRERSRSPVFQGAVVPYTSLSAAHEALHALKDRKAAATTTIKPGGGGGNDATGGTTTDGYYHQGHHHSTSRYASYHDHPPPPSSSSSAPSSSSVPPHTVLWIGGITSPRAMDYILDMADEYGRVVTHRHMRGCAFIEYSNIEEATAARRGMNGTRMGPGVYLKVEYKRELDPGYTRDGGGGGGRRGIGRGGSRSPPPAAAAPLPSSAPGGESGGPLSGNNNKKSLLTGGPSGREGPLSWSGELCKGLKSGTNTVCYVSCYDGTGGRGPMMGGGATAHNNWIDMEPRKWPDTLEVTNRVPIKGVCQDLYASLLPGESALLRLLPRDPDRDGPGLVSFCAYLESKDRAGVVELPPVVPVGERSLLLIPPNQEVCRRLGVTWPPVRSGMSHGCMLGLIVPRSRMR